MRIGFLGFTEEADALVPPPAEVSYVPDTQTRQELTLWGLRSLSTYSSLASYNLQLRWKDLPERALALLARIPPNEQVTLVDQAGKEWEVVFDEPTRAMLSGVSDRDGSPLYSASMTAHPVVQFSLGESSSLGVGSTVRNSRVFIPDSLTPREPPLPPQPTPTVSPIKARARRGLPPTVSPGEGVRFTFDNFLLEGDRARYYAVDGEGYLELLTSQPPDYPDWYSSVQNQRLVEAELRRFPWRADQAWTLGMLLYPENSLEGGYILRGYGDYRLQVSWNAGVLRVALQTDNSLYFREFSLPAGTYAYLGLQYAYGLFMAGLGADLQPVEPVLQAGTAPNRKGLLLGGGAVYVDDLLVVSGDGADLQQVRAWLMENEWPSTS